jgi:hypothetical protein
MIMLAMAEREHHAHDNLVTCRSTVLLFKGFRPMNAPFKTSARINRSWIRKDSMFR